MGITSIVTRQGGSYTENDKFSIIMAIRVIFCIRHPMQSYSTIITRHGGSYTENDTFSVNMAIRVIFCIRPSIQSYRSGRVVGSEVNKGGVPLFCVFSPL